MLPRMVRSRLIIVALLGLGVAVSAACNEQQQNGQECLKHEDCESNRCIQYVCTDPSPSKLKPSADTGVVDAAADVAADTTSPPDTATDTGVVDTGTAADTATAD